MSALDKLQKNHLISRFSKTKMSTNAANQKTQGKAASRLSKQTDFRQFPGFKEIELVRKASEKYGLTNPYFRPHEGVATSLTCINGQQCINFSNYNYLGLNGDDRVNQAAADAIAQYGTSVSASRIVSGERPIHRALEAKLAEVYKTDDALTFVSGHATNVTTIGHLFGPKDLILHDSLIHNSSLMGIEQSGAQRRAYAHNDTEDLKRILSQIRGRFQRCLILTEGLYSMDGDSPDLADFVAVKRQYDALLMVDEAHSLGVLGKQGRGIFEEQEVPSKDIDIWMGTLSKTLAGCGGYIAGSQALIDQLRYGAPGFVYSVGLAPPLAAASLKALEIMLAEPERVARLRSVGEYFLQQAKQLGMNTGKSIGASVVPVVFGSSLKAARASEKLLENGVNVQPIIYPAVEERAARLRFFLSSTHETQQIDQTLATLKKFVKHPA